jgi:transcriptional regulator with XRE-family HTH domain
MNSTSDRVKKPPSSKAVILNPEAILRHCRIKGFDRKRLAARAGISYKTVQRAISGQPISIEAMNWIASALDQKPEEILAPSATSEDKESLFISLELRIPILPNDSAALSNLIALLEAIRALLPQEGGCQMTAASPFALSGDRQETLAHSPSAIRGGTHGP